MGAVRRDGSHFFFVPSLQGGGFYQGWGIGEAPLTSEALNQPEGRLNSCNATLKPFNLLFVHRDTETQSFVFLKTFVSLNKSLTFDHLRASSYGTHLIAILCLYFPPVSDATALPQGGVFSKTPSL